MNNIRIIRFFRDTVVQTDSAVYTYILRDLRVYLCTCLLTFSSAYRICQLLPTVSKATRPVRACAAAIFAKVREGWFLWRPREWYVTHWHTGRNNFSRPTRAQTKQRVFHQYLFPPIPLFYLRVDRIQMALVFLFCNGHFNRHPVPDLNIVPL
jgi:hypothetical protein